MNAEIGTPGGSSQSRVDGRTLVGRRGEARVRVRGLAAGRLPIAGVQSLPCQSIRCAGGSLVMPSHQTSPSSVERDVGEDDVLLQRRHGVEVGLFRGAGRDAEEAGLRVDRVEPAVLARLDPGDVVADRGDLPAVEAIFGGISMAKLVLPQADGKAAAT